MSMRKQTQNITFKNSAEISLAAKQLTDNTQHEQPPV